MSKPWLKLFLECILCWYRNKSIWVSNIDILRLSFLFLLIKKSLRLLAQSYVPILAKERVFYLNKGWRTNLLRCLTTGCNVVEHGQKRTITCELKLSLSYTTYLREHSYVHDCSLRPDWLRVLINSSVGSNWFVSKWYKFIVIMSWFQTIWFLCFYMISYLGCPKLFIFSLCNWTSFSFCFEQLLSFNRDWISYLFHSFDLFAWFLLFKLLLFFTDVLSRINLHL